MSTLAFKPDWDEAKQRYTAWWQHKKLDRCLLWVTAPRDDADPAEPPPMVPSDPEERWTNLDYLTAQNDYEARRTYYGAEAFPRWNTGYAGHVSMPSFYGCPFTLDHNTAWHTPILTQERLDPQTLQLRCQGKWWDVGLRIWRHACKVSRHRMIPGIPGCGVIGDTLAALRGTERLLFDVVEDPQTVCELELKLVDNWVKVLEILQDCMGPSEDGYASWFPLWAPGRFYPTQCDFAYNISPDTYRTCFLPALRQGVQQLDFTVYHVDGVGNFVHVDELCRIDSIQALQIAPGAGKPSPLHYLEVLRKVQRAGKNLHITLSPREIPVALELLSARGLCIATQTSSETHARQLIDQAHRLSVNRN